MGQVRKRSDHPEPTPQTRAESLHVSVTMKEAGRILLPADARAALGVSEGQALRGYVSDGVLYLMTAETALRRLQEKVRQYVPSGVSLADELIAERRAENERESKS